jgi:Family of unknown function (DUF6152)
MKTFLKTRLVLTAALLMAAANAWGHHSFAAEYDDQKPVKLTGVLTKIEWQNPHIWYYLDVKGADGSVANWAISGGAPGQLQRRGITKKNFEIGATVTVEGSRAKDGTNNAFGSKVTYMDGRNVLSPGGGEDGRREDSRRDDGRNDQKKQ